MPRDPTEQLRTASSTAAADRHWTISTTYCRLRILGFDEREAGNLTAYVSGIAIGPVPWTVRKLTHLLFLREMNLVGRCWSDPDDRASTDAGDGWRLPRRTPRHLNQPVGPITLQSRVNGTLYRAGVERG